MIASMAIYLGAAVDASGKLTKVPDRFRVYWTRLTVWLRSNNQDRSSLKRPMCWSNTMSFLYETCP